MLHRLLTNLLLKIKYIFVDIKSGEIKPDININTDHTIISVVVTVTFDSQYDNAYANIMKYEKYSDLGIVIHYLLFLDRSQVKIWF